jgi:hypothetical protein
MLSLWLCHVYFSITLGSTIGSLPRFFFIQCCINHFVNNFPYFEDSGFKTPWGNTLKHRSMHRGDGHWSFQSVVKPVLSWVPKSSHFQTCRKHWQCNIQCCQITNLISFSLIALEAECTRSQLPLCLLSVLWFIRPSVPILFVKISHYLLLIAYNCCLSYFNIPVVLQTLKILFYYF